MQTQLTNKKKFVNLNKPWKELLFSASGFGPNFLMVLMGAYFQNAVNPSATSSIWQTISGICLVLPWLFSILWFIGRVFDGVIDIPLAALTDGLKSKFGKRRIPMAIAFAPMVVGYAMCWFPVCGPTAVDSIGNTIWIFFWAIVFFASYTMSLIAFYGSFSTVCSTDLQRARVSSYKSFFDTISYCLVYALVPVILEKAQVHIDVFAFCCLPLMLTMIIPIIMIKEGARFEAKAIAQGYDITPLIDEKPVKFGESIKLTAKNKPFLKWLAVNCCSWFGLQIFLVSMNALMTTGLDFNGTQMTIANTFAFAPVPVMLYLFNKIKDRKGIRFAYQVSLILFAIGILCFFFGSNLFWKGDVVPKMIFVCFGGICGSFSIGSFFMMTYLIPSQIGHVERQLTNKNHSSMYFAAQALSMSIVGAISSSLIWENIKGLYFSDIVPGVIQASSWADAIEKFGVDKYNVFNLGVTIVPFIVVLFLIIGFGLTFLMPKHYSHEFVGCQIITKEEYNKISQNLPKPIKYPFVASSLIAYDALWVLSLTIFSWIWYAAEINASNTFAKKKFSKWWILLAVVLPPFGAYICYEINKQVYDKCIELGIKTKKYNALIWTFGILCLSCVGLSLIQYKLNKIANIQNKEDRLKVLE